MRRYAEPGSFLDVVNIFGRTPTGQASVAKGVTLGDKKFTFKIPPNLPASLHYVVELKLQGKTGITGTSSFALGHVPCQGKFIIASYIY